MGELNDLENAETSPKIIPQCFSPENLGNVWKIGLFGCEQS